MKFIKTDDTLAIDKLRVQLYKRFSAPIEGMWEVLYIAASQDYFIENGSEIVGYCCIGDKDNLTQIFLGDEYNYLMSKVIGELMEEKLISSASLSSIEPVSFNACLFHAKSIQTNTFCFEYANNPLVKESSLDLELASKEDIQTIQTFLANQVGFEDNFGYTENLIGRKEQFMIKESNTIIATGEYRRSDSQLDVVDLGMIVHQDYRKKGLGTQVLLHLAQKALKANKRPICSTTIDNIASKKAIEKAGFYCSHIIFDMDFVPN